jgi:hypothetical protein
MALHILQPGLRPIGQFDLKAAQTVTGGEIGVFEADTNTGNSTEDPAAADVLQVGPISNGDKLMVALGQPTHTTLVAFPTTGLAGDLRFLLDDGTDGYGTLMGSAIGGTAGLGVTYGRSASGAVVAIGPATHFGSGKVTCWHAPGLYAIDGTALTGATQANATLYATSAGILTAVAAGDSVAIAVGDMNDDSLVSTTLAAAGESAAAEKFAFYFLGQK